MKQFPPMFQDKMVGSDPCGRENSVLLELIVCTKASVKVQVGSLSFRRRCLPEAEKDDAEHEEQHFQKA